MKLRFLSIFAAAALLAACESAPEKAATTTGGGQVTPPSTTASGPVAGSKEEFLSIGDRVFFDFDKSVVRADGKATLDKQVAWLKKYENYGITIEGNCDERGTREYNLALGERRANAVKQYLVANGIPAARVKTISYGKERPTCMASTEACWAQNRNGITALQ